MDGAVDPAPASQRAVRCVDDGIGRNSRDIAPQDRQRPTAHVDCCHHPEHTSVRPGDLTHPPQRLPLPTLTLARRMTSDPGGARTKPLWRR